MTEETRQPNEKAAEQATEKSTEKTGQGEQHSAHRHIHKERVYEGGQDTHNDPNPSPENLSGTPLGSDPRE